MRKRNISARFYTAGSVEAARDLAMACWGIMHGLVSLELSGNLPPELDHGPTYQRALRANLVGWLA